MKRSGVAALVCAVLSGGPAGGQESVELQACVDCPIQLEHLIRIGDTDGPGLLGRPDLAFRTSSGQWLVVDIYDPGLKVYDAAGDFVRKIGRRGQGPGEFELPMALHETPGDSIEVADVALLRVSTLGPDLTFARSRRLDVGGANVVFLGDGWLASNTLIPAPESIGLPVHLLDPSGHVVESLGADPPVTDLRDRDARWRWVAPARDGQIWVAELPEYAIERWSRTGERTGSWVRRAPWFEATGYFGWSDDDLPPGPGIHDVHEDESGLVWVLLWLPDEEWEEGMGEGTDPYGRPIRTVVNYSKYMDSAIEVFDPRTGQIIASMRWDTTLDSFVDDRLVFGISYSDEGEPFIDVYTLSIF